MKVTTLREGQFVTRINNSGWKPSIKLAIGRVKGKLHYYREGTQRGHIPSFSTAYTYDDFYYCDQHSNKLKKPISFKSIM